MGCIVVVVLVLLSCLFGYNGYRRRAHITSADLDSVSLYFCFVFRSPLLLPDLCLADSTGDGLTALMWAACRGHLEVGRCVDVEEKRKKKKREQEDGDKGGKRQGCSSRFGLCRRLC